MSILAETQPSRQDYVSAVTFVAAGQPCTRAGEVDPSKVRFTGCTSLKSAAELGGIWLDCRFEYHSDRGLYVMQAAVHFSECIQVSGRVYLRSCTCRDWGKRDQSGKRGEAALCKHLIALRYRIQSGVAGIVTAAGTINPAPEFSAPSPLAASIAAQAASAGAASAQQAQAEDLALRRAECARKSAEIQESLGWHPASTPAQPVRRDRMSQEKWEQFCSDWK